MKNKRECVTRIWMMSEPELLNGLGQNKFRKSKGQLQMALIYDRLTGYIIELITNWKEKQLSQKLYIKWDLSNTALQGVCRKNKALQTANTRTIIDELQQQRQGTQY